MNTYLVTVKAAHFTGRPAKLLFVALANHGEDAIAR
jgi:hypothetical protein